MTITAPIFKWASWGKSDDIFVGIPDSFQDSQNIDIRTNPRGIKLNKALVKDSLTVVVEPINCFIKVSTGDILAFGNSWGVYHKTGGVWYKNTNSITGAILSAIEFNGYVYMTNSTKLYRVAIGSIGHTMTLTEYQTFTNGGTSHPMTVYYDTFLLIGDKFGVAKLDTSSVWTTSKITLSPNLTIKYIYAQGSSIKIYCQDLNNISTIVFWDWLTEAFTQSINLSGVNIQQLQQKDWLDYVISNNKLGIIDWYKASTLKDISGYSTNLNSITVKDNKILYWVTGWVYEWGNLNKNYPEVLSNSYNTSNAITDTVGAIFYDGTDLYVSWSNGSTYWIDKLSTSYKLTWYITCRVYYSDTRVFRKSSINVLTSFALLTGTDSIGIYYRENISGSFTLLRTITAAATKTNDYTDIVQLNGEWNFIEFKIVLNSASWTTTPEFYELFLEFDNLKI